MKTKLFSYSQLDTFIHRLSGLTKLVCFLLLTSTVMLTFDIRIILCIMVLSLVLFKVAQIDFKRVRVMFVFVFVFLATNFVLTFLFSPKYGVEIYGTEHVLFVITERYTLTLEQLFYQISKFSKYLSVIPLGCIFFFTTNPSEFASSLNSIGLSYKACSALSLTLRYFPDVQGDYHTISLAQQARGVEMSSKAGVWKRLKNMVMILVPLIFSTLDRVELITNAMELRGYGKHKKRTWYSYRKLGKNDWLSIGFCLAIFLFTMFMRFFVTKSMFYNPFI
ncbi:MAG: energy-coupling factor transporter transmembrane component T family protein [Bulleidia sp.]